MRIIHTSTLSLLLVLLGALGAAESVVFLDAAQARSAIVDESVEPYFSRLQPREMATKTGSVVSGATVAEQREVCKQRYRDAVQEFTMEEQRALREVVISVLPALTKYPLFAAEPWSFIKLNATIEGGLPHTRGHSIVLSETVLPLFVALHGRPNPRGAELLVHEQTHVVERLHPASFATLFTDTWGFVRMTNIPTQTTALLAHQLVNPDGIDAIWAFPLHAGSSVQLVQPQVVLASDALVPSMPADFGEVAFSVVKQGDVYAYQTDATGEPLTQPLHEISAYTNAFAPADEIFHPNEIAAVLFSHLILRDMLHARSPEPASIVAVRTWAEAHLHAAPTP